jgi:hypothetical protein
VNHSGYGQKECPDRNCNGNVQSTWSSGVAQSMVLVPNVRREDNGTGQPGCNSPHLHMNGRQGENPADEEVGDAGA